MDTYEGQLKEFVEKRHFRYNKMQTAFAAAKEKWLNINERLNIKLRLLEFTICFYANVKKVQYYVLLTLSSQ